MMELQERGAFAGHEEGTEEGRFAALETVSHFRAGDGFSGDMNEQRAYLDAYALAYAEAYTEAVRDVWARYVSDDGSD